MTHCRNCKRKDRKQQFHWAMKFIRNPSNFYFRGWRAYESRCCVLIILLWQPTPTSRTRHPFRTLSHNGHKTRLVWHQRCFTTLARTPTTNRRKRLTFTIYTTKVVPLKTLPVLSEGKRCESEGAFRLLFFHSILISLSLSLSLSWFFSSFILFFSLLTRVCSLTSSYPNSYLPVSYPWCICRSLARKASTQREQERREKI